MNIIFGIVATIIVCWAVPTAFDPKYRYNEHQKYQPGIFEIAFQWILSMLVIWRIWLWNYNIQGSYIQYRILTEKCYEESLY